MVCTIIRWWCSLCFVVFFVSAAPEQSTSLADTVHALSSQVSVLLRRRQEDYKMLEESLLRHLEKNTEIQTLRTELSELRREVKALRGGGGNERRNEQLTVQWLSSSVSELRTELTELAESYNASAQLQHRLAVTTDLTQLRDDATQLRHDMVKLRATQERSDAQQKQQQTDLEAMRAHVRNAAAACADLHTQFQASRSELMSTMKSFKKSFTPKHVFEVISSSDDDSQEDLDNDISMTSDRRHSVQSQMNRLTQNQQRLERQTRRLEKHFKTLAYARARASRKEDASPRLESLEQGAKRRDKAIFNVTRQLAGVDKIHLSVLQLLESVEALENKIDHDFPDLQREISKTEFNLAQVNSTVALIKEEQENQQAMLKAMSASESNVQSRLDALQTRINDSSASSLDDQPTTSSGSVGQPLDSAKVAAVPQLLQTLSHVQREYEAIMQHLPHDCSEVNGPNGLYLISPGLAAPVMTSCQHSSQDGGPAWTVVQRRKDGSKEFNRKWSEYAAGFGSPAGEYWLGNEALHLLTADNCSSLRIEMRDIYDRAWVAEYREFHISPAHDGYRIHVAGYSGNASDALDYQNRMQFSTKDSDRDISNTDCAANYEGGWWFSHCQHANLNGRYNLGLTWFDGSKNEWIAVAASEMKVRRRNDCPRRR